jgi:hypothetical protein
VKKIAALHKGAVLSANLQYRVQFQTSVGGNDVKFFAHLVGVGGGALLTCVHDCRFRIAVFTKCIAIFRSAMLVFCLVLSNLDGRWRIRGYNAARAESHQLWSHVGLGLSVALDGSLAGFRDAQIALPCAPLSPPHLPCFITHRLKTRSRPPERSRPPHVTTKPLPFPCTTGAARPAGCLIRCCLQR